MKAVLFDLDGTICDTIKDLHVAINVGLTKYGYDQISLQQTIERLGNGIGKLMAASIEGGFDNPNLQLIIEAYKDSYLNNCTNETVVYPGVLEVMKELKAEGYKLGVITNKIPEAAEKICEFYFEGLLDVVIGELPGDKRKPNKYGLLMATERMNVNLEDCIYVGDSEVDVKFAANGNVKGIFCNWGTRTVEQLQAAGAKYIVKDAEELLTKIHQLSK